ncbi:DUF817 domain-containing protein [Viridibacillus sp. FSL R5-0477]|uniref:YoaT protein n=1 Tax=Viridibacillus arenosi FSL R5-213 TaxID=1227360 RepID=W4F6T1_9BACL|nr:MULTISPECIES: DUF817 domain-containing protein [Viridibacillus]ETT88062.1 hypothetical protein C176_02209 [Viridibacillus arenosi FSL R5-213]OMC78497.1 hypothetical protein BK130_20145 [Viridibacillus sp. FSL H8-0123]OMC88111.1 hypothetical protein BK137_19695 [Viridibacillus arenosi]
MERLLKFTYLQAISCIFPVIIFATLALSNLLRIPYLPRYDFILIICLAAQVFMLISKLETWDEFKVICLFHVIGLGLELFKVHMGSWSYPEEAYSKIFGVPLYSGFMYASVASYICQSWRRLDLHIYNWPKPFFAYSISILIYMNFFTHHYIYDLRWVLKALLLVIFFRTTVTYKLNKKSFKMPMILSFFLIGFFIWIAENIVTFFGAWQYPNQEHTWSLVSIGKISSWFLLVIISIIIVAQLKQVKSRVK